MCTSISFEQNSHTLHDHIISYPMVGRTQCSLSLPRWNKRRWVQWSWGPSFDSLPEFLHLQLDGQNTHLITWSRVKVMWSSGDPLTYLRVRATQWCEDDCGTSPRHELGDSVCQQVAECKNMSNRLTKGTHAATPQTDYLSLNGSCWELFRRYFHSVWLLVRPTHSICWTNTNHFPLHHLLSIATIE